jgi:hypothetical protein
MSLEVKGRTNIEYFKQVQKSSGVVFSGIAADIKNSLASQRSIL